MTTSGSTVSPALGSWPPRSCVLRILSRQSSVPISVGGIGRIPDCQFWSMPELAQVIKVSSIAEHAQGVAAADAGDHDVGDGREAMLMVKKSNVFTWTLKSVRANARTRG